jgi:organic radical activating enzyme
MWCLMLDGQNYTSNLSKLLKHLDKLELIQGGLPSSPVMIHLSPTNRCNLDCSYCCYGLRDIKEELPLNKIFSALEQFAILGTKGLELTGGGDPSMYKDLDKVTSRGKALGYKVGLITNGIKLSRFKDFYKDLSWMRVSLHGLNYDKFEEKMGNTVQDARGANPDIDVSSVYIWTSGSENTLEKVVSFTNKYKIPTRLTPDLTLGKDSIDVMMNYVGEQLRKFGSEYIFLSDFNVKTTREHNNCYMHLIKPFVFTDGWVYDCPSLALSPDNKLNVNNKFRVCKIEDILETYSKPSIPRILDCEFCKYAPQNEFIHELRRETKHNDFA